MDGLRLRVVNYGVTGYVNWQASAWFADELAAGVGRTWRCSSTAANDAALAVEREAYGLLDADGTYSLSMSDEQTDELAAYAKAQGYRSTGDLDLAARLAALQYRRGVDRADRAAAEAGVPVVRFWQPTLATIPPDRPLVADALEEWDISRSRQRALDALQHDIAERSGVELVDITDLFDDVDRPVFFDQTHCNEFGADRQAAAILDRIAPLLGGSS
ncbi:MAG: hypothetical protein R2711_09660 [Acidimicrobiales bacterium]